MKRIRQINGYIIYQAQNARDYENHNCRTGNYNIYLASDVRDYGITYSTPEWEDEDSLSVVIARCNGSRYAVACALAEELSGSTAQDMDLVLEIERRLDAGQALSQVAQVLAPRYMDDASADDLYETIACTGLADPDNYDPLDEDMLDGDLEDVFTAALEQGDATDKEEEHTMTINDTYTIRGRELPACSLLENGIRATQDYFDEYDARRPYLPEPKLRYWAEHLARSIVIRTEIDGCTHDDRRPTTQAEHDILYKLALSALLGLNAGETNRQSRAAEDAIINAIEYACLLMLPKANSYDTIYNPLRRICEEWRSCPAEQLPRIDKSFPRSHPTSTHVEYADGSEAWEGSRYTVTYEGKVWEDDNDDLNIYHTDSSKLAHELYDYLELIGKDPTLNDEHYGVSFHRGDWD